MNELKVGILAIVTMIAVAIMSLKITSNQSGFGSYVEYRTIIPDASGIFPKTPIKIAGINAGRIKEIELSQNAALITFEVKEEIKVPTDSVLKIKTVGFLGDKYLEIRLGNSSSLLKERGMMAADNGGGMEAIMTDASDTIADLKAVVATIRTELAPVNGVSPINGIVSDFGEISRNLREASRSLKNIAGNNEERFHALAVNLEKFSNNLAYQTDAYSEESAAADLKSILASAKAVTADLEDMMADVKQGKGTVGQLFVEDDIADDVKETLSGVKNLVKRVDAIRTELSLYSGYNTEIGGQTYVDLRIFPSPERFYLLGIATSEFGPEKVTETTTSSNGSSNTMVETEREKDQITFNLQLGRKFQQWMFRAGLFESTGGIAVDYMQEDYGLRFSSELFDYRDESGFNLRLSTDIQVWNVVFGRIAIEDTIYDPSATFSAGVRFNDEDLKTLFGIFF